MPRTPTFTLRLSDFDAAVLQKAIAEAQAANMTDGELFTDAEARAAGGLYARLSRARKRMPALRQDGA